MSLTKIKRRNVAISAEAFIAICARIDEEFNYAVKSFAEASGMPEQELVEMAALCARESPLTPAEALLQAWGRWQSPFPHYRLICPGCGHLHAFGTEWGCRPNPCIHYCRGYEKAFGYSGVPINTKGNESYVRNRSAHTAASSL